jgi:hypothetical protein
MALFRRRAAEPADTIPQFWTWWTSEGAGVCAAAIANGTAGQVADEVSDRVHAIHPALAWELAAGEVSEHKLVVSAEGNPELRPVARRWLLAAPAADETWSYDDHRGPVDDPEDVKIVLRDGSGGVEIAFRDVRVSARKVGARFDATVHHPAFADLPTNARVQVAFLALDATLGEHDTEIWIAEIETAEHPPIDGFGLVALRAVVDDLRRESLDDDGRPGWALLSGDGPDGPLVATARSPLHPLFAPMFTRHAAAQVPYQAQTDVGLPATESLGELRALEDQLETAVGAGGMLVAHESSAGLRTFHFYLDPEGDTVDRLTHLLDDWPDGDVRVQVTDGDPGWESVRHLRG